MDKLIANASVGLARSSINRRRFLGKVVGAAGSAVAISALFVTGLVPIIVRGATSVRLVGLPYPAIVATEDAVSPRNREFGGKKGMIAIRARHVLRSIAFATAMLTVESVSRPRLM